MFSSETTALLRTVLDEVCGPSSVDGKKSLVALKLLQAAAEGRTSIDDLRQTGREALSTAPTSWR